MGDRRGRPAAVVLEPLHGLEEAQLSVEQQEQIGHEIEVIKNWNASASRQVLAWAVCRLYMVHALRRPRSTFPRDGTS